jgi:uncharacterized Zn finger protein
MLMTYLPQDLSCSFCHSEEFEVVRNDAKGFVVLCNECGFAQAATLAHLIAS